MNVTLAAAVLAASWSTPKPPHAKTACVCPCSDPAPEGPGRATLDPRPAADAFARNREGRELYRQRRWEEARTKYRAALAADPAFRGPRLNIACSYAQEARHAEAAREAIALLQADFVPGAREVLEAADLAPLRAGPEMRKIHAAITSAGAAWGDSIAGAMFFVARIHTPVRLPPRDVFGPLVLSPGQEISAWLPGHGRFRQVTAEDGRVLAFVSADAGRRLVYLRGGKLIRQPGQPDKLRGLSVRTLDVATMALGQAAPIEGDVISVELAVHAAEAFLAVATTDGPRRSFQLEAGSLLPVPPQSDRPSERVLLTATGVTTPSFTHTARAPCRFVARDTRTKTGPTIQVTSASGKKLQLPSNLGAGLRGLPFP